MKRIKEKFYDNTYGGKCLPSSRHGLMDFLYRELRRFEIYREHVVYELLSPGYRFLDVGCGDGSLVLMAKDKFREVYGVDISSVRIERARGKLDRPDKGKIHFLQHDVDEGLPFNDFFFDAIACVATLEHIFNPPALLDEIHRVVKAAGEFFVQVPNLAWISHRLQLLFGKLPVTGGTDELGMDWEHLHNFTVSSLRTLLESNGFEIKRVLSSGIFAKYRSYWVSLLSGDIIIKSIASK